MLQASQSSFDLKPTVLKHLRDTVLCVLRSSRAQGQLPYTDESLVTSCLSDLPHANLAIRSALHNHFKPKSSRTTSKNHFTWRMTDPTENHLETFF